MRSSSADTPDLLETALDKPEYSPGDTMTVAVTARTAGKVMLNVIADRLVSTIDTQVQPGLNQIKIPVGRDWGNGGYVVATLLRPLDVAAQRMPGRAIGVQWFSIDRKAKTLAVNLTLPPFARPSQTLRVPVRLDGLAGQEARLVVAAVDVGILNLTNYKPPAPDDYFLGQRRLTADVRDLYGQLIDGMTATRGQIRSGGDAAAELQGSPPTQPPVALYSGIVTVAADGTAEVAFDIPEFAGTLRVMAVAWSQDKVGRAVGDVTVRDPVVVTATLPRFILIGDRSNLQLELDNVEGLAGEYRVAIETDGPVRLGTGAPQALRLAARQRSRLAVPLNATGAGSADHQGASHRPGEFRPRPQLRSECQAGVAGADAPHGAHDRGRRKPDAVGRRVLRSRARHRQRRAVDWVVYRARCSHAFEGARPLSVRMLRADREPRDAAALRQRSRGRGAACP